VVRRKELPRMGKRRGDLVKKEGATRLQRKERSCQEGRNDQVKEEGTIENRGRTRDLEYVHWGHSGGVKRKDGGARLCEGTIGLRRKGNDEDDSC
jgi:hypothetical protein